MFKSLFLASLAVTSLPTSAAAAVVTFDPGNGFNSGFRRTDFGTNAKATWNEAGFAVDWTYVEAFGIEPDTTAFTFMSDCYFGGCFGTGTKMTFRRKNGGAFSLKSFDVPYMNSSWTVNVSFTPYDSEGGLDYANATSADLLARYNNLVFSGVTASGKVVNASASAFESAGLLTEFGAPDTSGSGVFQATGKLAKTLSNLTELSVSVGFGNFVSVEGAGGQSAEDFYQDFFRRSLLASGQAELFQRIPTECYATFLCVLPGVGEFSLSADSAASANWGSAVQFGAFRFDTVEPSAVPLPAAGIVLISGLAALMAIRGPRRAARPLAG